VLGLLLPDHLQGITLTPGRLVADQQDRTAGAGAELVDHAIFHAGELGCTRRVRHAVPRFSGPISVTAKCVMPAWNGRRKTESARWRSGPLVAPDHTGNRDVERVTLAL